MIPSFFNSIERRPIVTCSPDVNIKSASLEALKFTSLIIGLSLRFAMAACAGLPDLLDNLKFDLTEKQLKVSFNKNTKSLLVDHVYEKLNILSNYLGLNNKKLLLI